MKRQKGAFTFILLLTFFLSFAGTGLTVRADSENDLIWTIKASIPIPTKGPAVATGPNGKMYAFGGSADNWGYCAHTQEYDPSADLWTERASMPTQRGGHGAAVVNGKIHVIGGLPYPMAFPLTVNEAYDPIADTWTVKSPMPTPRFNFAMTASTDGNIYVMGGLVYPGTAGVPGPSWSWWWWTNALEVYNANTDTWETKAPMPSYRISFNSVALNGKILALGGYDALDGPISNLVEEYDPATDTWIQRASMNMPRYAFGAVVASNGKLYVSGGATTGEVWTDSVEEYDPLLDCWSFVTSMPTVLANHGATAAMNGKFYLLGGSTPSGFWPSVLEATVPGNALPDVAGFWIGLKNSDDQGTQFDLRAEVYKNGILVSSGETNCVTGVTRNPSLAKKVMIPIDALSGPLGPGDPFSLKMLTRIGTNPDGTKCSGPGGSHANAVGLRLYYDSVTQDSGVSMGLGQYFMHSAGATLFLDNLAPTSSASKYKDSTGINFAKGNPWKEIGTWGGTVR